MVSRRRFMGQSQDSRYTELEYIESTGTQYIDTGICIGKYTNCVFVMTAACSTENKFLFGSRNSTTGTNQGRFAYYVSSLQEGKQTNPQYGNTNIIAYNNVVDLTNKTTIQLGVDGFYQNDTKICSVSGSPTSKYSVYLLSCNTAGYVADARRMSAKLYGCQVYQYGSYIIMDLIPVFDNKIGVACMYDKVNHKFYYNAGTGEFLYEYKQ